MGISIAEKITLWNQSKLFEKIGNIFLIVIHLQILGVILTYKQLGLNLPPDLIPEEVIYSLYSQYVNGGIQLSLGLLIMLLLKIFHRNFWVCVVGILTHIIYIFYFSPY